MAERILRDIESVRLIGKEYSKNDVGELAVATTHTHARYCLPKVIDSFTHKFPNVKVTLQQGKPGHCCEFVATGDADVAISTETLQPCADVISLPAYRIRRCIVARRDHPILKVKRLTLEKISQYPIITFDAAFDGQRIVNDVFSRAGLKPHVVLSAADPEVTKAYVERGMGIAIFAQVAFNPVKDTDLRSINAEHLFKSSMIHVSLRKQAYLRSYIFSFISLYAPHLSRDLVLQAIQGADIDIARLKQDVPLLN
jgi:LysR family cys regulon transcriptional activator